MLPLTDALGTVISPVIVSQAATGHRGSHACTDGGLAIASLVSTAFARDCQLEIAVERLELARFLWC